MWPASSPTFACEIREGLPRSCLRSKAEDESRPAADEAPRHTREKIFGTRGRQGRLLTQTGPPSDRNEMIDRLPEKLCNIFRFYDNHFLVFEKNIY